MLTAAYELPEPMVSMHWFMILMEYMAYSYPLWKGMNLHTEESSAHRILQTVYLYSSERVPKGLSTLGAI